MEKKRIHALLYIILHCFIVAQYEVNETLTEFYEVTSYQDCKRK